MGVRKRMRIKEGKGRWRRKRRKIMKWRGKEEMEEERGDGGGIRDERGKGFRRGEERSSRKTEI